MTARDRAKEATVEAGLPQWGSDDQEQLEMAVEQAITAAVEEDRRARPHTFVGRTDRPCELCGEPDRDEIHIASREMLRNRVRLAVEEATSGLRAENDAIRYELMVTASAHKSALNDCDKLRDAIEEEREACAKIADYAEEVWIAEQIRERCNTYATENKNT